MVNCLRHVPALEEVTLPYNRTASDNIVCFIVCIRTLPGCGIVLMTTISYSFSMTKEAVWWEMAPAAAPGHRGGCYSLCWWPGNRNSILGAPCWHFHQWKNPSWKICQQGNNSAGKFISINNTILIKNIPREVIQRSFSLTLERGNNFSNE